MLLCIHWLYIQNKTYKRWYSFMKKSIIRKSFVTSIMSLFLSVIMLCTPAFAAATKTATTVHNWTYLQYPSSTSTVSTPVQAIVSNNNLVIRFVFDPTSTVAPFTYCLIVSDVDSNGTFIKEMYNTINAPITSTQFSSGGITTLLPTTGYITGHIYRVQVLALYPGDILSCSTFGYYKF